MAPNCERCGGGDHVRAIDTDDGEQELCFDCREAIEEPIRGPF